LKEKRKIRVLVVDDSLLFRESLAKAISDDHIEVVAKATDPFDARDKLLKYEPDVMTCDVEMPKMNGIEFIKRLLPQYSIPVIVISGLSESVFDAMKAGAVDFIQKPHGKSKDSFKEFVYEIKSKIIIAASAKVLPTSEPLVQSKMNSQAFKQDKVIAIGASTGGTEAISSLLKRLPCQVPGIVIVQHIPPVFSRMFAERLDKQTHFMVKEAKNGDFLEQGHVLIAPGDRHMRIKKLGDRFKVECFEDTKVNGHCPSVDILFDSVAKYVGENAIGVILTGMGYDGAKGLLSMRRKGAHTIGQSPQSCVVYGMPKVAYDLGAVEIQSDLSNIPNAILSMLK